MRHVVDADLLVALVGAPSARVCNQRHDYPVWKKGAILNRFAGEREESRQQHASALVSAATGATEDSHASGRRSPTCRLLMSRSD